MVFEDGREGLLGRLGLLAGRGSAPDVIEGIAVESTVRGVVFLFAGQGSQWNGMALRLLESSPIFAEHMWACGEALAEHVDWSLDGVLRGAKGAPGLDRVDVVQPALFAVMVSLAGLWEACGVRPAAVVGHSQGEIAAAYVAGRLSLRDAARVVTLRSQALAGLVGKGGMVSVALGAEELAGRLERWGGRVAVAAVNGPATVVVSGDRQALGELLVLCSAEGVRAREIPVGYASHSPQIEELREELLGACAGIVPRSGGVPFFSTVTGGLLDAVKLDGEYWYRNLRETVQFERATRALLEDGQRTFIELSPHAVLTMGVQETVDAVLDDPHEAVVVGSLRRDEGGPERFLTSLAEAWVRGVQVDWSALFRGSGARRVGLPTYAFQRERYWLEAQAGGGGIVSAGQSSADHPLLSAAVGLADDRGWLFTGSVSLQSHPWLSDHAVRGSVLFPGTAFLELALHVGSQVGSAVVQEYIPRLHCCWTKREQFSFNSRLVSWTRTGSVRWVSTPVPPAALRKACSLKRSGCVTPARCWSRGVLPCTAGHRRRTRVRGCLAVSLGLLRARRPWRLMISTTVWPSKALIWAGLPGAQCCLAAWRRRLCRGLPA